MRRYLSPFLSVFFVLLFMGFASATNGDNLMAIGPIARSMGGVGVAAPQDAISAVFANPAAMCFGPYCPGTEVNFGGTLFMPTVDATVTTSDGNVVSASSDKKVYAIPAIGLSVPITNSWRFGLAAYGVSGLGVDYRDTAFDTTPLPGSGGAYPLVQGAYTQLQIMKFSPSIAYQVNNNLSLGLGVHIDYANLDLRNGSSFNYGIGAQLGAIYKASDMLTLGATYITPQEVDHQNVVGTPGGSRDLKLESPQQIGVGISVEPIRNALLVEVDGRWINWSSATGYDDFDWKDQWVLALGVQYKPTKQLALRAGYNYANNPVNEHNNFVGFNGTPNPPTTFVQGIPFPNYYYETFRIIGFPAVAKQHVSFGIGYELSNKFALNAGYTHAFEQTISESGTTPTSPTPVTLKSTLSEDSVEFGITWRF
ncbi:MAG: outer membrane protein transport protein [Nitrospiraceae bacterium]|nr:outer membrane protein transport protein [Nitrospiraceae bacterium]